MNTRSNFDFFHNLFKLYEDAIQGKRNHPTYSDNALGITALLYCPLKYHYRQSDFHTNQYSSLEILDGFDFEHTIKSILQDHYGAIDEFVVEYEYNGTKIEGHLDVYVPTLNVALELKNMRLVKAKMLPADTIVFNPEEYGIELTQSYLKQAGIQKTLLDYHTNKTNQVFLVVKTTLIDHSMKAKKVIIITQPPAVPLEEINTLIEAFHNEKKPRYPWECKLCPYTSMCKNAANLLK